MHKIHFFTRTWCLFLCLLLLVPTVGCATKPKPTQYLDKDLSVESVQVIYSADFMTNTSQKLLELYCRILPLMDGPVLSPEEQAELLQEIRTYVLPMSLRAGVSEQEWDKLIAHAEAFAAELSGAEDTPLAAYCRFYQKLVAVLGHERAGLLCYDGTVQYLDYTAALYEARYRDYGYEWYLEDALRYRARLSALYEQLDAKSFGEATRVLVWLLSFTSGVAPVEQSQNPSALIYDGEMLLILRMQAQEFANISLNSEQWQLIAALYGGLAPQNPDTAMEAELSAMQEAGITSRLFGAMPELLSLYHAVMQDMTETDVSILRQNASDIEKSAVTCRVLAQNEAELLAFLRRFEALCASGDGAAERRAMQRLGLLAACDTFLAQTASIDTDQLLCAIAARAAMQDGEGALHTATIAYLKGQMPYLAFALSEKGGS
ncbi:MAG: hypothetical protein J6B09_02615 [Clostridia bacterium]|nr:hypothetical protein [Clostridia bacterium]